MPKTVKNSATLSTVNGMVTKVSRDPIGGTNVFIGKDRHYVPQKLGSPMYGGKQLRSGMKIRRGDPISAGAVNPHEMLPLAGIERVQGHLTNQMHDLFRNEGIRRRNHEVLIKGMTNLSKIEDIGDGHGYIRGDYAPSTQLSQLNRTKLKGKRPITHQPVLRGVDVLPLDMQEDWMAKLNHERLSQTVQEAAQRGWKSQLHGKHPIPPLVYGAEFGSGEEDWEY